MITKLVSKVLDVVDKFIPDATVKQEIEKALVEKLESDAEFRQFILDYEGRAEALPPKWRWVRTAFRLIWSYWVFLLINLFIVIPERMTQAMGAIEKMPPFLQTLILITLTFWFGERSIRNVLRERKG